jgi:hypothetical protein
MITAYSDDATTIEEIKNRIFDPNFQSRKTKTGAMMLICQTTDKYQVVNKH